MVHRYYSNGDLARVLSSYGLNLSDKDELESILIKFKQFISDNNVNKLTKPQVFRFLMGYLDCSLDDLVEILRKPRLLEQRPAAESAQDLNRDILKAETRFFPQNAFSEPDLTTVVSIQGDEHYPQVKERALQTKNMQVIDPVHTVPATPGPCGTPTVKYTDANDPNKQRKLVEKMTFSTPLGQHKIRFFAGVLSNEVNKRRYPYDNDNLKTRRLDFNENDDIREIPYTYTLYKRAGRPAGEISRNQNSAMGCTAQERAAQDADFEIITTNHYVITMHWGHRRANRHGGRSVKENLDPVTMGANFTKNMIDESLADIIFTTQTQCESVTVEGFIMIKNDEIVPMRDKRNITWSNGAKVSCNFVIPNQFDHPPKSMVEFANKVNHDLLQAVEEDSVDEEWLPKHHNKREREDDDLLEEKEQSSTGKNLRT